MGYEDLRYALAVADLVVTTQANQQALQEYQNRVQANQADELAYRDATRKNTFIHLDHIVLEGSYFAVSGDKPETIIIPFQDIAYFRSGLNNPNKIVVKLNKNGHCQRIAISNLTIFQLIDIIKEQGIPTIIEKGTMDYNGRSKSIMFFIFKSAIQYTRPNRIENTKTIVRTTKFCDSVDLELDCSPTKYQIYNRTD